MDAYRRTRIAGLIDPLAIATVVMNAEINGTFMAHQAATSSLTWSHTVTSGTVSRALVVTLGHTENITSVTYNGTGLTQFGTTSTSSVGKASVWYLVDPAVGTHDIVVTSDGNNYIEGGSFDLAGVNQGTPLASYDSGYGTSGTPSLTISGQVGDIAVGLIKYWDSGGNASPGGSQEEIFNESSDGSWKSECMISPGDTSVVMNWTVATYYDATYFAVMIKKAV